MGAGVCENAKKKIIKLGNRILLACPDAMSVTLWLELKEPKYFWGFQTSAEENILHAHVFYPFSSTPSEYSWNFFEEFDIPAKIMSDFVDEPQDNTQEDNAQEEDDAQEDEIEDDETEGEQSEGNEYEGMPELIPFTDIN